jgi:hypothetical protein
VALWLSLWLGTALKALPWRLRRVIEVTTPVLLTVLKPLYFHFLHF